MGFTFVGFFSVNFRKLAEAEEPEDYLKNNRTVR